MHITLVRYSHLVVLQIVSSLSGQSRLSRIFLFIDITISNINWRFIIPENLYYGSWQTFHLSGNQIQLDSMAKKQEKHKGSLRPDDKTVRKRTKSAEIKGGTKPVYTQFQFAGYRDVQCKL